MSNLKQLVWHKDAKKWQAWGAGISYTICGFDSVINVTINNLVKRDKDEPRSSDSKTFTSYSAALEFVEREHYPHFMGEFVKPDSITDIRNWFKAAKPAPTWIDASERLPDKSGRYMVVHQTIKCVKNKPALVDIDSYDENEKAWIFFRSGIMQEVTHWMPIPEFSTMQNNKGE